jgi:hypothetical protein
LVGRSVQPETNDHRRMALASNRWLHKIEPVEPQILTGTRNIGISNIYPTKFEIFLRHNHTVQHTIRALLQHTDLHVFIHTANLDNLNV